jgi:hypothetical protein
LALALRDIDVAEKHLAALAALDFTYKDVSTLLDKVAKLRENPESAAAPGGDPSEAHGGPEADPQDPPG